MILIGIKTINTSTGDYSSVTHQQTDVLAIGTTEELTESYNKHFLTINLVYINTYPYLCITELVINPTGAYHNGGRVDSSMDY